MSPRIVAHGTYVPRHRLDRLGRGTSGTRAVAGYDEDTTSMAVEAARAAIASASVAPQLLAFATTLPAYADRTNATAIHAAIGLDPSAPAYDMVGSVRSGLGALRAAADSAETGRPALAVLSDIRTGLPGSADERDGGDGAVAFVIAGDAEDFAADIIAHTAATAEVFDRWRVPGENWSRTWEDRFTEAALVPLALTAVDDGLKAAGISIDDADHVIVTGTNARAVATTRKGIGARADAFVDDRASSIGIAGCAHAGLLLADVIEQARSDQVVVLVVVADGAECVILRTGPAAGPARADPPLADRLADGLAMTREDSLVWRGLLRREPPRRPDPERPAAPPAYRNRAWKFGLVAGRCTTCGTRHLPPERVCLECGSVDAQLAEPMAGVRGTVTTFAVDHLAFSVAPPVVVAVIDFDGGGRLQCEVTDVRPEEMAVGLAVEPTFRRLHTSTDGVHDYFWKVRPVRVGREAI